MPVWSNQSEDLRKIFQKRILLTHLKLGVDGMEELKT